MSEPTPERLGPQALPLGLQLADAFGALMAERDGLKAELAEIRQRDETTGGVLYDVIRRAIAGDLDDHEAVRQIERRLIHPLVAQRREARERARRAAGRRRPASD